MFNTLWWTLGIPYEYHSLILYVVVSTIVLMCILFTMSIARSIAKKEAELNRGLRMMTLLVTLPKSTGTEDPSKSPQGNDTRQIQEQLALAENVFANIGALKPQEGFLTWWRGRTDGFSVEIVARGGLIYFYWIVPVEQQLFIEQQIHAQYPLAEIEPVDDYNIFTEHGFVCAGEITLLKNHVYPIKSYRHSEGDPASALLNALARFGEGEAGAIQVVIRPNANTWQKTSAKIAKAVAKGEKFKTAVKNAGVESSNFIGDFFISLFNWMGFFLNKATGLGPGELNTNRNESESLTAQEQETLKSIEEKATKAGLATNIRLVVVGTTQESAERSLDNLAQAFGEFNIYEYANGFKFIKPKKLEYLIHAFIMRAFNERTQMILNTEELASVYHLPLPSTEVPNIVWLMAKKAAPPANVPSEGTILGYNEYRGRRVEIKIKLNDRLRHMYVIGKSGVGKSVFLQNLAAQDIRAGHGVCVIDPHGDLVDDILYNVPKERAEDVILFDPANLDRPMGLNMLEYDSRYPEQKTFAVNELLKIFDRLYDLKATGGPMFEYYVRNAMLLLMDDPSSGSTLMEITKVLADDQFRAMKLRLCKNQDVKDFWLKQALKAGGESSLANMVPYIASKFASFITNDYMRPIIGQQESSFVLRDIMDNKKILLLKLSKGRIGDLNAYLLGMILVGKILMAALSRTDIDQKDRAPFFLYIDEFQNFITDSINAILSEARKYGLGLTIAHQFLGQLVQKGDTSIKDAIFGNVGTMAAFRVGAEDGKELEREFGPTFNAYDLTNVPAFTLYMKLLIDNTASKPFNVKTYPPLPKNKKLGDSIAQLSSLKYGRDRALVEEEIRLRSLRVESQQQISPSSGYAIIE